ncbi:energy-converting hydrogenase Eha subunit C [Sphingomonas kyeonggiensis]|uniref:hypothetical protein n=1 Tax=Sphingomonas kyeonggiensis TaxID=1268553 RepID=UPI0027895065|nr:hypothetical protein [Sphingomonas kyeonggiensis]MDQ0252226.1 energy-converting hydrogenase Eha subunit C [Sphingomonas kyeonggiensis]
MNKIVYLALLVGCCLYALARGGTPERAAVGILVSAVAATILSPAAGSHRFYQLELNLLVIDGTLFLAMTVLALKAQRYWPMWLAAVKLNTVVTHLLILSPTLPPWSYAIANAAWSYPSPLLIAIGAVRHRQRLKRYGADPAWS